MTAFDSRDILGVCFLVNVVLLRNDGSLPLAAPLAVSFRARARYCQLFLLLCTLTVQTINTRKSSTHIAMKHHGAQLTGYDVVDSSDFQILYLTRDILPRSQLTKCCGPRKEVNVSFGHMG